MNRNHKDKKDKKDKKGVKVSTFGYLFLILAILTKNGPGEATVGISNMKNWKQIHATPTDRTHFGEKLKI